MTAVAKSDSRILGRLLLDMRRFWPHLLGLQLLELLAIPLSLLSPLPLKIVVDSVLAAEALPRFLTIVVPAAWQRPSALLPFAVGLLVAVALLRQLLLLFTGYLKTYVGGKLVLDFRNRLFAHGQRLSLSRHDRRGVSDALYRIQYDTPAVENIAIHGVIPIATAAMTVLAMVYVTSRISAQLAMIALLVSPLIILLVRLYQRPLRNRWREQRMLDHAAMSVITEVFSSLRVVKAFTQEEREGRRYSHSAGEGLSSKLRVTLLQSSFDLLVALAVAAGAATVLFVGARAIEAGAMTVGDLLVVMAYLAWLYQPLRTIGTTVATLQKSYASAERAFALLDESSEVAEHPGAMAIRRAQGRLSLREVCFAYDSGAPVLQRVSLEVPARMRMGIAGKTGAGKTTLINLLMRFYDPTTGRILLDGVDLRQYRLKDLRRQFSLVLQDAVLFSTSVRNNIAYARPEASEEDVFAAAELARAHEFIRELPDGYDTLVGERGMRLSGGERQRIALARAFLRDAPILILDEPTSAVDVRTEAAIMEATRELMRNRTTFMVAHRLTTLSDCHVLVQLEGGRVQSAIPRADGIVDAVG